MFAIISTTFDCTAERLWDEISRPASLRFVSAPLLHFAPLVPGELESEWVVGKTYALRLSLFGYLPAGEHRITLASIDSESQPDREQGERRALTSLESYDSVSFT